MTDATLPAARPRKILTQIAPVSWEHPADRAALQTLRSVPGFDEVVKKIVGFFGEPRDRAQRLQRGTIRRMLPRHGSDLGENFARASRGQCGVSHLCRLQQWDSHTYAHDMRVFR